MKKFFYSLVFILLILSFSVTTGEASPKKVLVIYDSEVLLDSNNISFGNNIPVFITEQLGHFDTKVEKVYIRDYQIGDVEKYDYIFYLGLKEDAYIQKELLNDLTKTKKIVFWYGEGSENLLENNKSIPIGYEGKSNDFHNVYYQNEKYVSDNIYIYNYLLKPLDGNINTYGEVGNGLNKYPLILNWKNYWFMTGLDFYEHRYLIFSDVLHEVFKEKHQAKKLVYLRIEDIHALRNPKKLRAIADFLYEEKVPFIMATIPIFINPNNHQEMSLIEKEEIVSALHYMVDKGGSVILHGCTHQYYKDVSGEGFEFWDGKKNQPLALDEKEYIHNRFLRGTKVLLENNLYPLGFEPPHYAMSQKGYIETKKYFSTFIGQLQTTDKSFITAHIPYKVENTDLFNIYLSENLGYVDERNPKESVQSIIEKAENNPIIRDSVTGVFFHSFVEIDYLKQIVWGLKKKGYEFGDIKELNNWVKIDDISITSENKNIYYNGNLVNPGMIKEVNHIEKNTKEKKEDDFLNKYSLVFSYTILILVILSIVIFLTGYYKVHKKRKELFKEEKNEI